MLTLSEVRGLAKRHNFYLKKSLGQNLLIDRNVRDKIINLIGLKRSDILLEIGPGLGALTERLAEECGYLYAVEKDKRLYELAKRLLAGYSNLSLIYGDFLKFDIKRLMFRGIKVVGALPYYITTPIIEHLLDSRERIDSAYLIVQREVGRRLASGSGERDYGRLSLFVQFYSDVEMLADIKKGSFFPVPEVDSALVRLKVLAKPRIAVKDEEMLFDVIRASFGKRRKTILAALSHKGVLGIDREELAGILDRLNIEKNRRAEALSLEQFARISDAVKELRWRKRLT